MFGIYLSNFNVRFINTFLIFANMSKLNLKAPSKLSNVIMVANSMISLLNSFVSNITSYFVSLSLIHLHEMVKQNTWSKH